MARRKANLQPITADLMQNSTNPAPNGGGVVHEIVMRDPKALKFLDDNPKLHPPEQLEQLRASIREFGFTIPALVDEADVIRAGNGRIKAAIAEGVALVPTIVAKGWSPAQLRAYVIADNKLTENGGWDKEILRTQMIELQGEGFSLDLTGFAPLELGRMDVPGFESTVEKHRLQPDAKHVVVVECADEADQAAKIAEFMAKGLKVRALVL